DAVEAALRRIEQLVDGPIVVLTHAPRVGEFPPRRRDPHGLVASLEVGRQLTMRHEVEHTDLHACPPFITTYAGAVTATKGRGEAESAPPWAMFPCQSRGGTSSASRWWSTAPCPSSPRSGRRCARPSTW